MPAKFFAIILGFFFFTNISYSQAPAIAWQKCYGGTGSDIPYCINSTSDGGAIVCGYEESLVGGDITAGHGGEDCWVVKLDAAGTLMWQHSLGGAGQDFGNSIEQTADGGYIVAGFTNSNNSGDVGITHGLFDYWIVKLTPAGTVSWSKTYGGSGTEKVYTIHQTTDGGYILAGETDSPDGDMTGSHGLGEAWILKLDALGNIDWQRPLGGSGYDGGRCCISQTNDGGYIVNARTTSTDGDLAGVTINGVVWIVKLSANGNIEWQHTYGNAFGAYLTFKIYQTNTGYVALISTFWAGNHGGTDYCVLKLDDLGNLVWQKSFGGTNLDEPYDIIPAVDGGIIVLGWATSDNGDVTGLHNSADYWIIKVSDSGILLWQKALGGDKTEQCYSMCQATDGGYMIAGYSNSNNNGDVGPNHGVNTNDYWVVKLASGPLPVTLSIFNAASKGNDVSCSWKTQQESNSHHFIVERSEDAVHFIQAGNIAAAGNSSLPLDYRFTDHDAMLVHVDYLYYRLKMVDNDRSFTYSNNVVKIKVNHERDLHIYPNPVTDLLTVSFTSTSGGEATLSIIDDAGKKVYQKKLFLKKGSNIIPIKTTALSTGNYVLSLDNGNNFSAGFIKADQ